MEFKGTKGKWYPEQDKEYPTLHNIWSDTKDKHLSQGTLIARTCYAPSSEANALLISKAPKMLEYLQDAVNEYKAGYQVGKAWIDAVERLIKSSTL